MNRLLRLPWAQPADRDASAEQYCRKQAVIHQQGLFRRDRYCLRCRQCWRCAALALLVGFFERFQNIRHAYFFPCSGDSFGAVASAMLLKRITV